MLKSIVDKTRLVMYEITFLNAFKRLNVIMYKSTSKKTLKAYLKDHNIKYKKIKKVKKEYW